MDALNIFIGGNVLIVLLELIGLYADPAIGLFNRIAVGFISFFSIFLL